MATIYIDYVGGLDSNSTPAQGTPWKRHPYMQGFTGTYSHTVGDIFIFKGGVTWPRSCFVMTIGSGGNAGTPDQYKTDHGWFTGGAWSKPIFDFSGTDIANSDDLIRINASYVLFSDFSLINAQWSSIGNPNIINLATATNITISYCNFTNWTHSGTVDGLYCVKGATSSPFNAGCIVDNCLFDGGATASGTGVYYLGGGIVSNCTFQNLTGGIIGVFQSVYKNLFSNIMNSFDAAAHENGLYACVANGGTLDTYDNIITGVHAGMALYLSLLNVPSGGSGIINAYNNIIYNCDNGVIPITLDSEGTNLGARCTARVMNNTVQVSDTGACIRFMTRGTSQFAVGVIQNNHLITNGTAITYDTVLPSTTADHNLTQTNATASAQGYILGNVYAPTLNGGTIDNGADLSIYYTLDINNNIRSIPWDIGAYEFITSIVTKSLKRIGSHLKLRGWSN